MLEFRMSQIWSGRVNFAVTHPDLASEIQFFAYTLISQRPHEVGVPVREILDPPLYSELFPLSCLLSNL